MTSPAEPVSRAATPPKKAAGKKILGLPQPVAIALGAGVLTLAYLWYRAHKKAAAASATSSTSTNTLANVDTSQLAAELEQLLAEQSSGQVTSSTVGTSGSGGGGSASGTAGGGGTTTKTTTGTTTGGTTTKTTTQTGTGTTTSKTTTPAPPASPPPGSSNFANPPFNAVGTNTVHVSPSPNGAAISWGPLTHATSYRVRIEHGTTLIHGGTTTGTSQNISGLLPNTNYRVRIAGINNAGQGPWSAPVYFNTT
jgi:hypothetical protein